MCWFEEDVAVVRGGLWVEMPTVQFSSCEVTSECHLNLPRPDLSRLVAARYGPLFDENRRLLAGLLPQLHTDAVGRVSRTIDVAVVRAKEGTAARLSERSRASSFGQRFCCYSHLDLA